MRMKAGGARKYPSYLRRYAAVYSRRGTGRRPTRTGWSAASQFPTPGYVQWAPTSTAPTSQPGGFYNPMEYGAQNPAVSQPTATPGRGGYPQQPQPAVSSAPSQYAPPAPPSNQSMETINATKAWNDPPLLKPKAQPSAYVPPQPITAPIMGAPVEEAQQAYQQPTGYQQQQSQQYNQQQKQVQQEGFLSVSWTKIEETNIEI
eukprot:XP_011677609.1 PREDICTED: prion-like-(Q/N-rich) domain-bearing protein 96 [Strongylocentrotus purpuratus]